MKEELLSNCYDKDGYLSLVNISNEYEKDPIEMKQIFDDYVNSITGEDIMSAYRFGSLISNEKITNIKVLKTRVKGYSDNISTIVSKTHKKQEMQFLKSINNICEEYYKKEMKQNKKIFKIC